MPDHEYDKVLTTDKQEGFQTGSVRGSRAGKGRFDLLPPLCLKRMARHYENGAVVYGDHNWQKGQPISRYLDSALRHLNNFHEGDTAEDHLAAAAWNVWAIMWTRAMVQDGKLPPELDDLKVD